MLASDVQRTDARQGHDYVVVPASKAESVGVGLGVCACAIFPLAGESSVVSRAITFYR